MDSILIISDEPALADTLQSELTDIAVAQARFREAAAKLGENRHRLVVLDETENAGAVPDVGKLPVLRLSRPVVLSELLYTIRERLQGKSARAELALPEGVTLSLSERLLRPAGGGTAIALTEKELDLLQCLLDAGGQIVSREALLRQVWGYQDDIATHTLETHIYRLRGKLRQASEALDILSSETGGYQLRK